MTNLKNKFVNAQINISYWPIAFNSATTRVLKYKQIVVIECIKSLTLSNNFYGGLLLFLLNSIKANNTVTYFT